MPNTQPICWDDVRDSITMRLFGRCDNASPERQELIDTYMFEIAQRCAHYCHVEPVDTLPAGLEEAIAAMTVDLIRSEGVELEGGTASATLENIRLGDAQFGFGCASSVSQSIIDSILRSYKTDLLHYRQMAT